MHDILVVLVHSFVTVVRLIKPGGLRAVVAESALTRHQLLILNRSRKRAPSLLVSDLIIACLFTFLRRPSRMLRCGIVLKPSTLLHFHHLLTKRKYHMLFSAKRRRRPGPKGPAQELIDAVVEMKRRNPTWGLSANCPANYVGLRRGHRQGRGAPDSWKTLRARVRIWWSVLAHLSRSGEGQFVEHRPVSL